MKKTASLILVLILTVLMGVRAADAIGTLTAQGDPGDDTQYSLNDIYSKLIDFSDTFSEDSGSFTASTTVAASFHTLSEIYGLLENEEDDLVAGNIADGVEIFGVEGTLEGAPADLEWSVEAPAGLCWSDDIEFGCSPGSGLTAEGYDAVEYCQYLEENGETLHATVAQNIWQLPTIYEFSLISDHDTFEPATQVAGFSVANSFWSRTEFVNNDDFGWRWSSYTGSTDIDYKYNVYSVRCVR